MVTAPGATARIDRWLCCGIDILPTPLLFGVRIFTGQCARQLDPAVPFSHGALVFLLDVDQMLLQCCDDRFRQESDAILVSLPFAHRDLQAFKIEIFHAESQAFHQPQAATVQL